MLRRLFAVIACAVALQGCGTVAFNPPVHPLAVHKITDFELAGKASVENDQPSDTPVILHAYGGNKLQSNYRDVTHTMVTQALYELGRHGQPNQQLTEKRIGLKVTHLHSRYIAFFWKGSMTFDVSLGDAAPFSLTVHHSTGMSPHQNLSGAIADGVVALFKDERVLAYLRE